MYRRFIAGKEDVSDTVNSKVAETVYVGKSIKSPKSYVSAENKGCDEKMCIRDRFSRARASVHA